MTSAVDVINQAMSPEAIYFSSLTLVYLLSYCLHIYHSLIYKTYSRESYICDILDKYLKIAYQALAFIQKVPQTNPTNKKSSKKQPLPRRS